MGCEEAGGDGGFNLVHNHRNFGFIAVMLTVLTVTGCSATGSSVPSETRVFATLDEARAANPGFRQLDSSQLTELFAQPMILKFPQNDSPVQPYETISLDREWSYYEPQAYLFQIAGEWSVSNNMLCVKRQNDMGTLEKQPLSVSICRKIWADRSMRYAIIRPAVIKTSKNQFYLIDLEKQTLRPGYYIDKPRS